MHKDGVVLSSKTALCIIEPVPMEPVERRLGNQIPVCANDESFFLPLTAMEELCASLFPFPHMNYKILLKYCCYVAIKRIKFKPLRTMDRPKSLVKEVSERERK